MTTAQSHAGRIGFASPGQELPHEPETFPFTRAAMLGYALQANQQDIDGPLNIPRAVGMHYIASGKQIDIGLANGAVEKRQVLFNDGAANSLTGKKLADHLYGGAGVDTLSGHGARATSQFSLTCRL